MHRDISNPMPEARSRLHHLRLLGAQVAMLDLDDPDVARSLSGQWIGTTLNAHGIVREEQVTEEMLAPLKERAGVEILFAQRWARCGFPLIAPTHRLAASLMWTVAPPEALSDERPPWSRFAIVLPGDMLSFPDAYGNTAVAKHILVQADEVRVSLIVEADAPSDMMLTTVLYDSAPNLAAFGEVSHAYDGTAGSMASRALTAARRLVLGSVLELGSVGQPPEGSATRASGARNRKGLEPNAWTFKLSRDVVVDARPSLAEYLGGVGSPQRVQTLVRGHWQRYAVGLGREQREWRHKEPYWKGPEDAPIAVRTHEIG